MNCSPYFRLCQFRFSPQQSASIRFQWSSQLFSIPWSLWSDFLSAAIPITRTSILFSQIKHSVLLPVLWAFIRCSHLQHAATIMPTCSLYFGQSHPISLLVHTFLHLCQIRPLGFQFNSIQLYSIVMYLPRISAVLLTGSCPTYCKIVI